MAKRPKKTRLPRVTVLAYNRRELAAFVEAVERLGLLVNDLSGLVPHLRGVGKPPRTRKPAAPPAGSEPLTLAAQIDAAVGENQLS